MILNICLLKGGSRMVKGTTIKRFGLIGILMFLTLIVAACGQGDSTQGDGGQGHTFVVGTDAAYAPFEWVMPSGEITGFDIDILKAIAVEEEMNVRFENTAWEGIFETLKNGERDILISAITINEDRKKDMDFTDPYFEATQLIAVPEGSPVSSFDDLKGKKVGVQTGTTGDLAVSGLLGKASNDIYRFESTPLALQEMLNKGIDAVVADNVVILEYIKNNPEAKFTSVMDDSFEKEHYGIAIAKENQELLDKLNNGLKKIKENGTYDEIYHKYFGE